MASSMPFEKRKPVACPCKAYQRAWDLWELIYDLLGGTICMQEAREKWLPKEEGESPKAYSARLKRSTLYNGFRDAINNATARPFSHNVVLVGGENLDDKLKPIEKNADRRGNSLTVFLKRCMKTACSYGTCHVIVDFPDLEAYAKSQGRDRPTKKDERDINAYPYFRHISPLSLISWRYAEDEITGMQVLDQIRIYTKETRPDGDYGEKDCQCVEVWDREKVEFHECEGDAEDFTKVREVYHNFGEIPIRTLRLDEDEEDDTAMIVDPPFEDLAWLNLTHWQSHSDQRNILRYTRIPILYASGFTKDELTKFEIGSNRFIRATDAQAKIAYAEHNGIAVETGQKDVDKLELKMDQKGLQPFIQRSSGTMTATEAAIDSSQTHSQIQSWIVAVGRFSDHLFELAAKTVGVELPDDFRTQINNDFGITFNGPEDIRALLEARRDGLLDTRTVLIEFKRRGFIEESHDIETIMQLSDSEQMKVLEAIADRARSQMVTQPKPNTDDDDGSQSGE